MAELPQPASAPPQPGQFVFSETSTSTGRISRLWLSADGRQPGITGNGDVLPSYGARYIGYRPDLPTDPRQVLPYLTQAALISEGASNNAIGKTVLSLLQHVYLIATQRAGLYEFLAATPGFSRSSTAIDAIGREGVGIRWSLPPRGGATEIIFDPTTYSYLGGRTWPAASFTGPTSPYNGSALITMVVVDRAGEKL